MVEGVILDEGMVVMWKCRNFQVGVAHGAIVPMCWCDLASRDGDTDVIDCQ